MAWFYPHNKPPEYVYTSAFASGEVLTAASGRDYSIHGEWAEDVVAGQKNLAGVAISEKGRGGAAIIELTRMIGMARSAEQQFLISHGLKNPGNDWNKLITEINKILSTEAVFRRNVQLLKQFSEGDIKRYEDITVLFRRYLRNAIYDNLVVDVNATAYDILERAVKGAIHSMSNITETQLSDGTIKRHKTSNESQMLQAFTELFGVIEVVSHSEFLEKIDAIFQLSDYIEAARTELLNGKIDKRDSMPTLKYKGGNSQKGTLAEILYTAVAQGLGSGGNSSITWQTVEHTGGFNYKPDRVLATMDMSYNQAANTIKNDGINYGKNVRPRGIATMEQLYIDLADAKGDIVFISDKNYLINQAFVTGTEDKLGGFSGQSTTSLSALDGLLSSLHVNVFNIDALINYLANIGSNLIEKNVDERILRAISAQIGNFLFDDLSFNITEVPIGINAVHVFQLSGVYVPLSIVLEGVKMGLGNIQNTDLSSYVEIDFHASGDQPGPWGKNSGEEVFEQFRNAKMQNNNLSIKFLRDFASIIANTIKL